MNKQKIIIGLFLIPLWIMGQGFLTKTATPNKHIKIALLLDTSNSMDGLIDQAKAQLWEIVNELAQAKCENGRPNLAIALYEYGNDNLVAKEGYIRQILGFSTDLDLISEKLFSLKTRGGNEYCGQVIQTSLNQLDWGNHQGDLKMIFIAGNEEFTQGPIRYRSAVANAVEKEVIVNTIYCGNFENGIREFWKNGADLAKGEYMAIDQNKKVVYIPSPYDNDILDYNNRLNSTYIPYGSYGESRIQNQIVQDKNASSYSEANAVKRAISKSSHLYKNSAWDLVDAIEGKDFQYSQLKKHQLPTDLQGKSVEELKTYVQQKRVERANIQKEIQVLNEKRSVYVAAQKKLNVTINVLEDAMLAAIKKQAIAKGFWWDK